MLLNYYISGRGQSTYPVRKISLRNNEIGLLTCVEDIYNIFVAIDNNYIWAEYGRQKILSWPKDPNKVKWVAAERSIAGLYGKPDSYCWLARGPARDCKTQNLWLALSAS